VATIGPHEPYCGHNGGTVKPQRDHATRYGCERVGADRLAVLRCHAMPDADLQRKQATRWRFVNAVYDMTDGNPRMAVVAQEASDRAGVAYLREGDLAVGYLVGEGLLTESLINFDTNARSGLYRMVAITHKGVKEVEEVRASDGKKDTEHFSAAAIHFHGPVGSVQAGGHGNTAHVSQVVQTPAGDVVTLVEQLHAKAKEHGDPDAIASAEKALERARAGDLEKVRFHAAALNTVAALTPFANRILTAITGIGA
jgi:hypothetical protein